ncbi:YcnI family copper-binding membrane protein [Amycolatopsis taiwanensis]|uniref:YncI copper-binding domain-containing protein n=1 Tax=Amycolatopsis taiwanensis TaxID=342230 RepID=A0A9W6VF40_9PSEU|nr:YcnI family protein [Amycolatopsis taiwanensis]GLY64131.1 hypothetical protein Atai01_07500 [Amycolatopsis taiwanensis]
MSKKSVLRASVLIGAIGVTGLLGTGVASAHVTANSYGNQPQQGGSGTIVLRVPNEEADAGTVKVEVDFKPEYGINSVRYRPVPGWTAEVTKTHLPTPVRDGKNLEITDPVTKIVWTAQPGGGLAKGTQQFQEFEITASNLPANVDTLELPAIQTYDNDKVVNWNQSSTPGGAEPENPAPTIRLAAASTAGAAHDSSAHDASTPAAAEGGEPGPATDDTARWLGGAGLLVGALGVGFGAGALVRGRKAAK